jgi:hypothetical protein
MGIKWNLVFLVLLPLMLAACETAPQKAKIKPEKEAVAAPAAGEQAPVARLPPEKEAPVFTPASISEEVFRTTKIDIQNLVGTLNQIIRVKDFNTWVSYLAADYLAEISSPDFLEQVSNLPRWQNQKKLIDVRDYFLRVVVPARDHDRVDDIEFIGERRVKAYTVNNRGQRLRLYELEDSGNGWKIVN